MELFENARIVCLRSHNDKFLVASEDQESVFQDRDGSTRNAHWTVEIFEGDHVCFKSCYGKYLTASNKPFLPGRRGRNLRVIQTLPDRVSSSVQWLPVREGDDSKVSLRTPYGNVLQSNGGPVPWRNSVTHDIPRGDHDQSRKKMIWKVEVVDAPSDLWRESQSLIAKSISYVRTMCFDGQIRRKKKSNESESESASTKGSKETKKHPYPLDLFRNFLPTIR